MEFPTPPTRIVERALLAIAFALLIAIGLASCVLDALAHQGAPLPQHAIDLHPVKPNASVYELIGSQAVDGNLEACHDQAEQLRHEHQHQGIGHPVGFYQAAYEACVQARVRQQMGVRW